MKYEAVVRMVVDTEDYHDVITAADVVSLVTDMLENECYFPVDFTVTAKVIPS